MSPRKEARCSYQREYVTDTDGNAAFEKYLLPPLPEPHPSLPPSLPPSLLHAHKYLIFLKMICEDDLKVRLEAIWARVCDRVRVPNSEFVELLFKQRDGEGKDLISHANAIIAQSATGHPDDTSDLRVEPLGIHRSWISIRSP